MGWCEVSRAATQGMAAMMFLASKVEGGGLTSLVARVAGARHGDKGDEQGLCSPTLYLRFSL
jgi:hypothetical protein